MKNLLSEYPLVLSLNEVAKILGISTKSARELVKSGNLGSIKVGHLIKVRKDQLIDFLEQEDPHK